MMIYLKTIYKELKLIMKRFSMSKKPIAYVRRTWDHTYSTEKLESWQKRERNLYDSFPIQWHLGLPDGWKKTAIEINWWVNKNIEYVKDSEQYNVEDYWPISLEILNTGWGDCDGQAALKFSMLIRAGFPDDLIGLIYVDGHMFACVYEDIGADDFYILDNGNMTYLMSKASKVLPYYNKSPIFGFNLLSKWSYI